MGVLVPEQWKEPRYKVAYHTCLASGRWLSYTPSIDLVVGWKYAKRSLLVRKFSPFSDYVMLTWEKISGSPCFSVLQVTESWVGPGNEARWDTQPSLLSAPVFDHLQYAKTEGKGLGDLVTVPNCCNPQILCYQFYVYQTTSDIDTAFWAFQSQVFGQDITRRSSNFVITDIDKHWQFEHIEITEWCTYHFVLRLEWVM